MTRRRMLEIAVAVGVLLLLLAVLLVRPTARRTSAPSAVLFERAPGQAPDFGSMAYQSRIAISPDSSRALVLYPVEFEERADLFVTDRRLGNGYRLALAESSRVEDTPKRVGWLDASLAWVIVGYMYGTVSPGGDLFAFDPTSGRGVCLWASQDSDRTQAVEFTPPDRVRLRVFDADLGASRDSLLVLAPGTLETARHGL
ncbi:MAG: DUF4652 domain-containing protein [Candidatus Eisenbacteria bacterium]